MDMLKETYEVKPFNQFPLGGCFDEAYISAAEALGVSNIEFLLNDERWLYISDGGIAFSKYERKPLKEFEWDKELFSEEYAPRKEEVADLTVRALKDDKLVITKVAGIETVNCQTGKKTQRSSMVHWVLVYGYDEEEKRFLVLERLMNISARYMPCMVSYAEYEQAYEKCCAKEPGRGVYILEKSYDTPRRCDLMSEYISYYYATRKERNWERKAMDEFLGHLADGEDRTMILNEVIKKYQRDLWIDEKMGCKSSYIDEFIRELQLVRTNCIRLERSTDKEHTSQLRAHAEKAKSVYIDYCNDKARIMEGLRDEEVLSVGTGRVS